MPVVIEEDPLVTLHPSRNMNEFLLDRMNELIQMCKKPYIPHENMFLVRENIESQCCPLCSLDNSHGHSQALTYHWFFS